jgi:predicted glycosyltransferase
VLVHSDPNLIKIEETFFRLGEIRIPLFYTGYIAKMPPVNARQQIRSRLEIMDKDLMIVASAGGGSVGKPLLESAMRAFQTLSVDSLAAADLSISMGGYNTSMNLLACGVPALVWPFGLNREQRLRAQRLAERGALKILNEEDLQPDRLARIMVQTLSEEHPGKLDIDLNGAANTVRWLEDWFAERNMHQ